MSQHALMFATEWRFLLLPAYRPESCRKHLSVVMAGTHLSRVINLSGMHNMIEQSPCQVGYTNNKLQITPGCLK